MRIFILFLVLSFTSLFVKAQIQDDFSDGDFTNNPAWSGDAAQFKVNSSKKLQLNSSGTDTSFLSTANSLVSNTEWRFYIKQSFNSSSNNYSRIYLVSDNSNLKNSLNGYFVQFGSTQDDICLYRQDGNSTTKIISGTYGNTGNSVNEFTIKVTRDVNGNWELFSDDQAGANFHSEGSVTDLTYTSTSSFGLWCKYTSSNSTKVYFDDVYVGSIVVDTIPPKATKVSLTSTYSLMIYFNEAVDSASAVSLTNYQLTYNGAHPISANWNPAFPDRVAIGFNQSFPQGQILDISIENIKDATGNISGKQLLSFTLYFIKAYDIVINEIMADPAPKVGLPEWEYIELYNRTNLDLSLDSFTLQIGNKEKLLPDTIIRAGAYVLIGSQNAQNELSKFGPFIPLTSFALTNGGQQLILKNKAGMMLHQIKYSDQWYADNNKSEGGWSLEQISPWNPCGCSKNWAASKDLKGGTPAALNSIYDSITDHTAPKIERINALDPIHIELIFSEPMDSSTLKGPVANYEIEGIGAPVFIDMNYPAYRSIVLTFANPIVMNQIYHFIAKGGIADCAGNTIIYHQGDFIPFGLADHADSNDIVINEILFNPQSGGVDYVEVYNRSEKILDAKDLRLANWDDESNNYKNIKEIAPDGFQLFPGEYYVFSTNTAAVEKQYFVKNPEHMIEIPSMISMANTSGNVLLLNSSFQLIDRMDYTEDMQFALLQNPKGISLERLNYNRPSNDPGNWHSAASTGEDYSQTSAYAGTPSYINSQFTSGGEFDGEVWLDQEIFSPDNDGYQDVLNIQFKFPDAGYSGTFIIYDSQGKLIRNLLNNELLSTSGTITWDGLDNQKHKANIGMYIIYVEVFNLQGDVKHFKLTTVLGGRL